MLKLNVGRIEERQATLIGFGLTEGNLRRITEADPVMICGQDVRLPGANFVIFFGGSEETFKDNFEATLKSIREPEPKGSVSVMHQKDQHYFLCAIPSDEAVLYMIGHTKMHGEHA